MPRVEYAEEIKYIPKFTSFAQLYTDKSSLRALFFLFGNLSLYFGTLLFFTAQSKVALQASLVMVFGAICTLIFRNILFYVSSEGKKTNNLISNDRFSEFYLNMGKEVYKHLGDGNLSGVLKNLTGRYLLLHAEVVKRMGAILATTGAGKTWFMQGVAEQLCLIGGASFISDAKGTLDEFKRTLAIWYRTGREKTSFLINLLNLDNSHAIDLFSQGSALQLTEICSVLIENDDPQWSGVEKRFIEILNKLLVYKRDNEGLVLIPETYTNYMSVMTLVDEAWSYRKKHKHDVFLTDFVKAITSAINIDYTKFCTDDTEEFKKQCLANSKSRDNQGVYNLNLGADKWMGYMTLLASNYGKIFNRLDPEINFFECVQHCKNVWVVLPTMESDETARKIGRIFLGIIKSTALIKTKYTKEPRFPYLIFLDEFGSIIVQGFGLFMSKARALGMAVWILFQSKSQLLVAGQEETDQIMQMCNVNFVMKMRDKEFAQECMDFLEESYEIAQNYTETKEIFGEKINNFNEQGYSADKSAPIKLSHFIQQNNGEMYMFAGSEYFRATAVVSSDPKMAVWAKKTNIEEIKFPLMQNFPKNKFMQILSKEVAHRRYFVNNPRFKKNLADTKKSA